MSKSDPKSPGLTAAEQQIARIIRVDQAGEFGAKRIYQGQLDVFKNRPGHQDTHKLIQHMADQEQAHLDAFDEMIADRHVRPTALTPVWNVAGYALGAATALMGPEAAMACTVAVEEVIDEHYAAQSEELRGSQETELKAAIDKFREEELEHRDTGLANGAEDAPAYPLLSAVIKRASKLAIFLSERV